MKKKLRFSASYKYIFLVVMCFVFAFPFIWMLIATTNSSTDIIKGKILPGTFSIENIKVLWSTVSVNRVFLNSVRNSVAGTLASIFICSMAGYGFQVFRDKAKDRLMAILLLSMMIPFAAVMIPLFIVFSQMGLIDTTLGIILPSVSTAFLIFFFRQATSSFPLEIIQAARIDGMGEFGIFFRIFFPVMSPAFAAAAIITFMGNWNNYLWPTIILRTQESQTMPMLLTFLASGYTINYGILMMAVAICSLPTIIVFVTQQRKFVSGIMGSVK